MNPKGYRTIPGYTKYAVNKKGIVINRNRETPVAKFLKGDRSHYYVAVAADDGKRKQVRVGVLVMLASGKKVPAGKTVDYTYLSPPMEGCDAIDNLEIVPIIRGRKPSPKPHGNRRISDWTIESIKADYRNHPTEWTATDLAHKYGVSAALVGRILNGKVHEDIEPIASGSTMKWYPVSDPDD